MPRRSGPARGVPRKQGRTGGPATGQTKENPRPDPAAASAATSGTTDDHTETPGLQPSSEKSWIAQWWPILLAGVAVLLLLATVTTIGVLSLRPPETANSTLSPEPTGAPVLPQEVGEYTRDAAEEPSAEPSADDSGQEFATGRYFRNGELAVIVTVVRPAGDSQAVIESLQASAIREAGGAICGRSDVHDVCVASRRSTSVAVIGWRGQTVDELAPVAVDFANAVG